MALAACASERDTDGDDGSGDGGTLVVGDSDGLDDGGSGSDKLDVGSHDPTNDDEQVEFSYIWISNSSQSTVSKIATRTLVEEGRYITREDEEGNPSRTSVNITGDVAVANRAGGITKFYAAPNRCVAGARTSSGPEDIVPWGDEGCRAWFAPMDYISQRSIAWTKAEVTTDPDGSEVVGEQFLWVTGVTNSLDAVDVRLLDGATGDTLEMITLDTAALGLGSIHDINTAYGGAVDGESNFWFHSYENYGPLVRVDRDDFSYRVYDKPHGSGYGIAVDPDGYVWSCSNRIQRFNPSTEAWDEVSGLSNGGGHAGCMADGEGRLWVASNNGMLMGIDLETFEEVATFNVPTSFKGISIDFDGFVWGISMSDETGGAYKVSPDDGSYERVTGLVDPYTYSDMTGFGLKSAGYIPIP